MYSLDTIIIFHKEEKMAIQKYMCSWCGQKVLSSTGRPMPGTCPRKKKTRDGKMKPHTWVKVN